MEFIINMAVKYLTSKFNPLYIENYIMSKKGGKNNNLKNINRCDIKIAAVEEKIKILRSFDEYIDRMYEFINDAVILGAQLVAFPEENGMLLLGMTPFVDKLIDGSNKGDNKIDIDLKQLAVKLTPFIKSGFETVFSNLSKKFGIYIMAGSVMIYDKGKIYNRAYLFGPNGNIEATQDKLHLMKIEKSLGLSEGCDITVVKTKIGSIAFPVCMDATYFETFKIAKNKGAEIVIIPIANIEEYNGYLTLRGIWPRVQESNVYGLKSALTGSIGNFKFTGKAGIYAPFGITGDKSGIVSEAKSYSDDEIVFSSINLEKLIEYVNPYNDDKNPQMYKKYYPMIYNRY